MAGPQSVGIVFLLLVIGRNLPIEASTHWIVTEDGKLQSQVDTVFNLRRPYDLVAFFKQEERVDILHRLKNELITKKEVIDQNEDKDIGLEQRFYKTNVDCQAAGKPLPEFDLYISTVLPLENKGIKSEEHLTKPADIPSVLVQPKCVDIIPLEYSIHAFEHLQGMRNRINLTGSPELGLKSALTAKKKVDEYGHYIYDGLLKNKTSWVLYNMAAFYWRFKGDPYQVVECLRRSLHFSPQNQKDIALISLANILHRARYSVEAAIVVHAALDITKELNVNHFTLGNIYAVLGEYNRSIVCFENTLKIQPDFDAASKRRHAVICHSQLEAALEAQHKSLQRTLEDLRDYQDKHEIFQREQERLLHEQISPEIKRNQQVFYEKQRVFTSVESCKMIEKDGRNILKCSWGKQQVAPPEPDDIVSFYEAEKQRKETYKKDVKQMKEDERSVSTSEDYSKPVRPPLYYKKHPETPNAMNQPYKSPNWPLKEECQNVRYPSWAEFPTTFLPAYNKGFRVKELLTEAQGLGPNDEHPLPWYPPSCVGLDEVVESPKLYDHLLPIQERTKEENKRPDSDAKQILVGLVNKVDATEEDIGQRILTALKKNIGPKWLTYNLAALFWRAQGNFLQSIECLRRSLALVKDQFRDVPLVNLASVLYKHGHVQEAITVTNDALMINDLEPATNFFMGNLLAVKMNITGAKYHYLESLKQVPSDKNVIDMYRTLVCIEKYQPEKLHYVEHVSLPELPRCQQFTGKPNAETESRVVCSMEKGREICIVETRSRNNDKSSADDDSQSCLRVVEGSCPSSENKCGKSSCRRHL